MIRRRTAANGHNRHDLLITAVWAQREDRGIKTLRQGLVTLQFAEESEELNQAQCLATMRDTRFVWCWLMKASTSETTIKAHHGSDAYRNFFYSVAGNAPAGVARRHS